ncbi:MAG: hypothetical protein CFH01_01117 [Alphaproteobacteria bacterium MarineAlpha2_Bin1]|nr:MAG: hypothetical protein CFH01_01117 [Alphaproteobacteria bacterium MarineAlpha2_Bin1]
MEIKIDKINYYNISHLDKSINNRDNTVLKKTQQLIKSNKQNINSKANIIGLNHMQNKSLSILQDVESGRTVYRHIDKSTDSIVTQFPRESELARIAFLNKIQKVALKKLIKESKN